MENRYLERYLSGEREQVWQELVDLGAAVREEPVSTEARAVAAEMMRRARHNVALLVSRLRGMGFRFVVEVDPLGEVERAADDTPAPLAPLFRELAEVVRQQAEHPEAQGTSIAQALEELAGRYAQQLAEGGRLSTLRLDLARGAATRIDQHYAEGDVGDSKIWHQPDAELRKRLARLEARFGPLPMTLYAWFAIVGELNLMGDHPTLSQYYKQNEGPISDPLVIYLDTMVSTADPDNELLDDTMFTIDREDKGKRRKKLQAREARRQAGEQHLYQLDVAPDSCFKSNYSGSGGEGFLIPDLGFDGTLEGESFIPYLRRCFAWGGFPGLENYLIKGDAAWDDVALLTRDLLPL